MNCHATRAVLDLHAEKRLSEKRTKSVLAHLASCAECRTLTAAPAAVAVQPSSADFKTRLAASLKAESKAAKRSPAPRLEASLWPRDFSGVAFAAAALVLIASIIGWSGAPPQRDMGDELAGRTP
jgi:anti-sigma factor RsiW